MTKNVVITFLIWNSIVALIYAADKRRARVGARRIREVTLVLCAFFLGAYGAIMGMVIFNHKTSKIKFRIFVPLAVILNTLVFVMIGKFI